MKDFEEINKKYGELARRTLIEKANGIRLKGFNYGIMTTLEWVLGIGEEPEWEKGGDH